ncbi:MAG: type II/IV secretion system protein [Elusimicrobia bacterium]|nr:type II/IV secretion system protein [Elusimicrobiota bacterium]
MSLFKEEKNPTPPAVSAQTATLAGQYETLLKAAQKGGRSVTIDLAVQAGDLILEHALKEKASDIHFETQGNMLRVRFRVDGILYDVLVTPRVAEIPLTQRLRVLAGFDPEPPTSYRAEEGRFQKLIAGRPVQVRVSSFPTINGEKLVLRILDRNQMALDVEQLGMAQDTMDMIRKLIRNPYGIFFVTGATGSGKTTTLYAMLKNINSPMINILTLEDPVEYRLDGINQAQVSSKTGFTFSEGLRTALRQDPNVIMLGEIRDYETAEIAMRAALTGHLVLATLHTINAPSVVERLFEMGTPHFLISSSVLGAMAQRLVRKVCTQCAQSVAAPNEMVVREFVRILDPVEGEKVRELLFKPGAQYKVEKGCAACRNSGFSGRVGIFELVLLNEKLRALVLEKSPTDVLRKTAIDLGMRTLLMDGVVKAWSGATTLGEVIRVCSTVV